MQSVYTNELIKTVSNLSINFIEGIVYFRVQISDGVFLE